MLPPSTVTIRYPVRQSLDAWVLPEGKVPEAPIHDAVAESLKLLLGFWAAQSANKVRVARNLAIRWLEQFPAIGIDPDVCVLAPAPDDFDEIGSLCLWKAGHVAPPLCFEIVSANHPHKDYVALQDRYAAMGTHELIVFDPLLAGPKSLGGPAPLQLWRRDAGHAFERVHFGDEPIYSEVLDAWVIAEGRALAIADDRAGKSRWLNETQHGRLDAQRARADAQRAERLAESHKTAKEALEREVGRLRAKLGER